MRRGYKFYVMVRKEDSMYLSEGYDWRARAEERAAVLAEQWPNSHHIMVVENMGEYQAPPKAMESLLD